MVEQCKPSIICLDNGLQLIAGIVDQNENNITTTIPLEVTRVKIDPSHEALSLRPWIPFTANELYEIKTSKVIAVCDLDPQYVEGFYKMTQGYAEDRQEGLTIMDALDDYDPEIDDNNASFDEIMDKIMKLSKPNDDQIH